MVCADFVLNQKGYKDQSGGVAKIMQYIATVGLSKQDLPTELRNNLDANLAANGNGDKTVRKRQAPKADAKQKAAKAPKTQKLRRQEAGSASRSRFENF